MAGWSGKREPFIMDTLIRDNGDNLNHGCHLTFSSREKGSCSFSLTLLSSAVRAGRFLRSLFPQRAGFGKDRVSCRKTVFNVPGQQITAGTLFGGEFFLDFLCRSHQSPQFLLAQHPFGTGGGHHPAPPFPVQNQHSTGCGFELVQQDGLLGTVEQRFRRRTVLPCPRPLPPWQWSSWRDPRCSHPR